MIKSIVGITIGITFVLLLLTYRESPSLIPVSTGETVSEEQQELKAPSVYFFEILGISDNGIGEEVAINWIRENWSDQLLPYFIEIRRFLGESSRAKSFINVYEEKTGLSWNDYYSLNQYIWSKEILNTPDYARFKQVFHVQIDRRFLAYFEPDRRFEIRLDEISWGGVVQDGIPPLRKPKMLSAKDADYLEDSDIVFGIEVNGDVRAYPKRILAWHEMFVDEVGGVRLTGVYCTLCGTVIAYDSDYEGLHHVLGTSGFLYRSNKLMYDQATQSLWSTLEGVPVAGPLLGKGIELDSYGLVTTTWGEWRQRHPETSVLSLNTGHQRNYDEGVAYNDYFSNDIRMFETPFLDKRLMNKDEVLALRFAPKTEKPMAISDAFLRENTIYEGSHGGQPFVILTDLSGANRVYKRPDTLSFQEWDFKVSLTDGVGHRWKLSEAALIAEDGRQLSRLPAHRAFWFGWHSAFPDTTLIQ